jgi:DNA-binding response OmpR family regulator
VGKATILVVDDERKIRELVRAYLEADGYSVVTAETGQGALEVAMRAHPDVIVLDLMLPDLSGEEVTRSLRETSEVPILMLTAKASEDDRVTGLRLGADDYLVKPFALPELLARIRALLRRGRAADVLRLKAADLEMDLVARRVVRGDRAVDLTGREFDLLEYLLRHQGHLVSREMLARDVWKEPRRATPLDNVIDVQMTRLRRKVDSEGLARLIHTVRGVGFVVREGEP